MASSQSTPKKKTANPRSGKKSVTSKKAWKDSAKPVEVTLPSGNVALIKKLQMQEIISSGIMPDNMAKIAQQKINNASKGVPQDHKTKQGDDTLSKAEQNELMDTPEKVAKMMQSFDRITAKVVVEPGVLLHLVRREDEMGEPILDEDNEAIWDNIPADERDPEELYTDEVDFMDKAYLFHFVVGGDPDLERFRAEWGTAVDAVGNG